MILLLLQFDQFMLNFQHEMLFQLQTRMITSRGRAQLGFISIKVQTFTHLREDNSICKKEIIQRNRGVYFPNLFHTLSDPPPPKLYSRNMGNYGKYTPLLRNWIDILFCYFVHSKCQNYLSSELKIGLGFLRERSCSRIGFINTNTARNLYHLLFILQLVAKPLII